MENKIFKYDLNSLLREGDALIIVPPYYAVERPSLGASLLQACAREAGFQVSVLYANIIWAAVIGEENYRKMCYYTKPRPQFIGERFFARAAYGMPPFGRNVERLESECTSLDWGITFSELQRWEQRVDGWVEHIASGVVSCGFKVVGCTTMFEQNSASVALLNTIKRKCRSIITIIGGANCAGEMAEGIASLGADIDYIFSDECETTFPDFLKQVADGNLPSDQIIPGKPCMNLDVLPLPDYDEYFQQFQQYFPDEPKMVNLLYETSRGCWWGQRNHCDFCGLNGVMMKFRKKSPQRVLSDLKELMNKYPSRRIAMTDNIMPYSYFKTLLPQLATLDPKPDIFYEQKANLSLEKVLALKRAGINTIQPGIEAFSTSLLKRMTKGVSAGQNIRLLRYAKSANIYPFWNLLYDFPGDECHEYEETLTLLPLLRHLPPPSGAWLLVIDRFSPYFEHPETYGITNIRPKKICADVFPSQADLSKFIYPHVADYQSYARENPDMIDRIKREIEAWCKTWEPCFSGNGEAPSLEVYQLSNKAFLLKDTRGLPGTEETQLLNRHQVSLALVGRRRLLPSDRQWALAHKVGVEVDGRYEPLAVAQPELIIEFETELSEKPRSLQVLKGSVHVYQQK